MNKIVVTGIFTENYRNVVELQKRSCKDNYDFDFRFISDEEWQKARTSSEFAFWGGNTIKTQLVIDKIKQYWNKIIVVADADIVFLKKTKRVILNDLKNYDMVFLKERKDADKNPYEKTVMNINIGFVAIRCNQKSLEFWIKVQDTVIEKNGWDQEIANEILRDFPNLLRYKRFSNLFLNGGDVNANNIRSQLICTSCGTIATKYSLTKYEYLNHILAMANGKENRWFDGTPLNNQSYKKQLIKKSLKKIRNKWHIDILEEISNMKKQFNFSPQLSILEAKLKEIKTGNDKGISILANRIENISSQIRDTNLKYSELNKRLCKLEENIYKPTIQQNALKVACWTTAKFVIDNMPKVPTFSNYLDILTFGVSQVKQDGLYLEFGVCTGRTINHISSLVPKTTVYGFDSFEGLPEDWRTGFVKGTFCRDTLPSVNQNVTLIKGLFEYTLPDFLKLHKGVCAFIHIDSDLYSSAKQILSLLHSRIQKGTILVFDEYFNYPGWQNGEHKAFYEFIEEYHFDYEYIGYVDIHEQVAIKIL